MKLIPRVLDRSIDNFFIVLAARNTSSNTLNSLSALLPTLKTKLANERGTVQILTDLHAKSALFGELMSVITSASFQLSNGEKVYFPTVWNDGSFQEIDNLKVLALRSKSSSESAQ